MTGAALISGRQAAIAWTLAHLALAGVIGLELGWGQRLSSTLHEPETLPGARADYTVQPAFTLPALQQGFSETTARPVFTPGRNPPPPAAATTASAMRKGQFVLLGSLITDDKKIAMLLEIATKKAVRVEQGAKIGGLTLSEVHPEKVVLTQGGDTEELTLKIQPAGKLPAAPKPAPAPPATAQPAQQSTAPPASPPAAAPPASGNDPKSLINRRRAARGLPPI